MFMSNRETDLTRNAAFFGYGLLITVATVAIHRYYLLTAYPLQFLLWAQLVGWAFPQRPGRVLTSLWTLQLLMSIGFLVTIHLDGGALQGDYGQAYHLQGPHPVTTP
jgi:hypothetical protein